MFVGIIVWFIKFGIIFEGLVLLVLFLEVWGIVCFFFLMIDLLILFLIIDDFEGVNCWWLCVNDGLVFVIRNYVYDKLLI